LSGFVSGDLTAAPDKKRSFLSDLKQIFNKPVASHQIFNKPETNRRFVIGLSGFVIGLSGFVIGFVWATKTMFLSGPGLLAKQSLARITNLRFVSEKCDKCQLKKTSLVRGVSKSGVSDVKFAKIRIKNHI